MRRVMGKIGFIWVVSVFAVVLCVSAPSWAGPESEGEQTAQAEACFEKLWFLQPEDRVRLIELFRRLMPQDDRRVCQYIDTMVAQNPPSHLHRLVKVLFENLPWYLDNTYHHTQFSDLSRLVALKQEQGLTVSVVLPSLNEGATIGKVVSTMAKNLTGAMPLVDEILVIDSGSTDNTCEIARQAGAEVYQAKDILPQYEPRSGKGDNLWKGGFQAKGDIVVYVDTDIRNIDWHFVAGLVGPLLERPELLYSKAMYQRPMTGKAHPLLERAFTWGQSLPLKHLLPHSTRERLSEWSRNVLHPVRSMEGGRVNQISSRPMFNHHYFPLVFLVQPLSGEYAIRRSALQELPFPVGYGVETSHLIDAYEMWGREAIAQVNLDIRIHRNSPTSKLGQMNYGILQTWANRMARSAPKNDADRDFVYVNFDYDPAPGGTYHFVPTLKWVEEHEREPLSGLPEYRARFGLPCDDQIADQAI